jgi:DNA invertase Pin-like site-specific DNA recombinase
VIYVRQSVAREESISLELQEAACREYATRHGYSVVDVIADPGVSGLKWERRPGIQRVMAMVTDRAADVVLVWRWSRLSRQRLHQAVALDTIERAGGRVESATEPFDTSTAGGEFGRDVMLAAAHFESRQKSEQWRETHARRLALGLPSRGGDRYGYDRDGDTYRPNPTTGPVLAGMYADYISGLGFTAIAAGLNAAGHRTSRGNPWTSDRVSRTLDSGFGAGLNARGTGPRATHTPGVHPPVIDADTWAAYIRVRGARAGQPPKTTTPAYLLTGLIVCGDCGRPMWANRLGRHAGYGYVCSTWQRSRTCRCVTVSRAKAERALVSWLEQVAGDVVEEQRVTRQRAATHQRADEQLDRATRQLDTTRARLAKLTLGWTDGLVPDSAYATARDELLTLEQDLTARITTATHEATVTRLPAAPIARRLLDEWDDLPLAIRREIASGLVARVVVNRPPDRGPVTVTVEPR